jgi:hypothetical protein
MSHSFRSVLVPFSIARTAVGAKDDGKSEAISTPLCTRL